MTDAASLLTVITTKPRLLQYAYLNEESPSHSEQCHNKQEPLDAVLRCADRYLYRQMSTGHGADG